MEDRNATPPAARAPKVSFVSLGCPKALVDSERIITRLRAEGYELARAHAGADLVVVNTCGFLDSAQAESLAAIGTDGRDSKGFADPLQGRIRRPFLEQHPGGSHQPADRVLQRLPRLVESLVASPSKGPALGGYQTTTAVEQQLDVVWLVTHEQVDRPGGDGGLGELADRVGLVPPAGLACLPRRRSRSRTNSSSGNPYSRSISRSSVTTAP